MTRKRRHKAAIGYRVCLGAQALLLALVALFGALAASTASERHLQPEEVSKPGAP